LIQFFRRGSKISELGSCKGNVSPQQSPIAVRFWEFRAVRRAHFSSILRSSTFGQESFFKIDSGNLCLLRCMGRGRQGDRPEFGSVSASAPQKVASRPARKNLSHRSSAIVDVRRLPDHGTISLMLSFERFEDEMFVILLRESDWRHCNFLASFLCVTKIILFYPDQPPADRIALINGF
jgi:hypothetical protein